MDIKQLTDSIMDFVEKGPSPDKQQWRIVLAKLEIMLHVIQEFGISPKAWDWRVILNKLVSPSFFNSNPDVRLVAIEVTLAIYKIVGNEVRQLVQEIEGLKPNIMQTITKRMAQIDSGGGSLGGKYITGSIIDANRSGMELEQIPEANENEDADQIRKSVMSIQKGITSPSPDVQLRQSKESAGVRKSQGSLNVLNPSGSQERLSNGGQ